MPQKDGPQNLQARVLKYFDKLSDDPASTMHKCMIGDSCVKHLNGKKTGNLIAHAKTHRAFFRKNFEIEAAKLVDMPARRLEFIQCCTEIVTVNGQPFADLDGSGFNKLIADRLQTLIDAGYGIGLRPPKCRAVRKNIAYLASEIIVQIKAEVDGKFVS